MTSIKNRAIAFGLAGALALGISAGASAGPLPTGTATVKDATPTATTDVQWRRHRGWGPAVGIGAGIAAGALIGSAVAARPYGYYYDEPVYGTPYAYDTPYAYEVAPAPSWGYGYRGGNYCEEGYRRVPCTQGGGY